MLLTRSLGSFGLTLNAGPRVDLLEHHGLEFVGVPELGLANQISLGIGDVDDATTAAVWRDVDVAAVEHIQALGQLGGTAEVAGVDHAQRLVSQRLDAECLLGLVELLDLQFVFHGLVGAAQAFVGIGIPAGFAGGRVHLVGVLAGGI